ncbi:MAG: efflux RND transporter permease subunit [Candidatus Binatia bacterium]
MTLGRFISQNRPALLGITALLFGAGLWAASTMPMSIFPEVAFHRITIVARAPHLPVEQTLTALTQPLENALSGVLGADIIRSRTTSGGVQLNLLFGWNQDMHRSLQLVNAAMEEVRGNLPAGTQLEARLLDTSAFPIVGLAVTSTQRTLAQMSDFIIYEAAPQFRSIPGVYRVDLNGAKVREYTLTVEPAALVQHHLTLASVEAAVRSASRIAGGGLARDGYHLALSVVQGQATSAAALVDVVVAEDRGVPVTLRDIARVHSSLREDYTRVAANGRQAILINVSRQPAGNTVAISDAVRHRMMTLAHRHPEYQFSVFYDQADLLHDALSNVRDSIAVGFILAVATIFFFLADVRATFVAALVIPTTVLVTCIVMHALGMSFNLMTLGGIAAGIGLILDDAIVVVENFYRHRARGSGTALQTSMGEIGHALLGSTLTPVAVLLPLGLLRGVAGAFFRPLALTMSIALLLSLCLALSFTPALASWMEPAAARPVGRGPGGRLADGLMRFYTDGLRWALRRPLVALLVGGLFVLPAWLAYEHVETGFVPAMDEGAFVLDYWSPAGTALGETTRLLEQVDAILQRTPEVIAFSRRTGAELGFFLTQANRGDYTVRLRRGSRRPIDAVISEIRAKIEQQVPALRVEFVQIMQDMIGDLSGNPSPIEIKLFGRDEAALERTARRASTLIAEVPGIVDNFDGITPLGPTYQVTVDGQRGHRVGLEATAVQHWIQTAITGTVVGQLLEGDRAIPLRLRYPKRFHEQLRALEGLTLVSPTGELAPLRSFSRLQAGPVAVTRQRDNLRQLVRVTARLSGRDLGSVMHDVRHTLQAHLALPAGVSLEYGGLYASQRQAFSELLGVFLAAVGCVTALLLLEFGSVAAVAAIVIGSSLALSGGLVGLWVTGTALNVSSLVGMIMVFGIVAKNGILLLDFAAQDSAPHGDLEAALIRAGRVRMRPILMTSLAALAGLAPLALGWGAGSQMQQPLAIAIIGGLSVAMLFSLLGVPLLYLLFVRRAATRTGSVVRSAPNAPAGG